MANLWRRRISSCGGYRFDSDESFYFNKYEKVYITRLKTGIKYALCTRNATMEQLVRRLALGQQRKAI